MRVKWERNSSSGETGQGEESFRQIDGDEGGLEIPPMLITTHDRPDSQNGLCVVLRLFVFFSFTHCTFPYSSCRKVALTSGGTQTILKHNSGMFRLA